MSQKGDPHRRRRPGVAAAVAAALVPMLAACVSVPAARMVLPGELTTSVREDRVGVGFGRTGQTTLDGRALVFRRGADRLELFGRVARDKASLSYQWAAVGASAGEVTANCQARRTELSAGIVQLTAAPWTFQCQVRGAARSWGGTEEGRLTAVERSSAAGTQDRLEGRYDVGNVSLTLESVHRFEGTSLPSRRPTGVVAFHQGRAIAAVQLTDTEPVLIRPVLRSEADGRVAEAATQALLAVALVWDPRPEN